jgi:hypothetical protein
MWINSQMLFWILLPVSFVLIIFDRARQIKNGQPKRQYSEKTLARAKKFYKIASGFLCIVIVLLILQMFFMTYLYFQHDPYSLSTIALLLMIYIFFAHIIGFQLTLLSFFQENLCFYKRVLLVLLGVLPLILFGAATCLSEDKISKDMSWKYLSFSIIFWVLNFPSIFLSKPWMKYYSEFFNAGIDHCARALLKFGNRKVSK